MVVHVCELLLKRKLKTAIVSRGYGAKNSQTPNDEAMELLARLPDVPHVQNPDRVAAAIESITEHDAEVIVLDDGFQHRRIERDLDIVLVDASNPFGYDYLLPRGLLREPVRSLDRAGMIVITRCESVEPDAIDSIVHRVGQVTSAPIALARTVADGLVQKDGGHFDLSHLHSGNWFVFSAIGNPANFEKSLEYFSCNIVGSRTFRDHHIYSDEDHEQLSSESTRSGADFIVCTHKDLVKLAPEKLALPVYAIRIGIEIIDGQDMFESAIDEVLMSQ